VRLQFVLGVFSVCLLISCAGGPPQKPGEPPPVAAGQLALRVEQARQTMGATGPGYLDLAITLANGSGGNPVPLNPLLFQVRTSDGLYYAATVTPTTWVDGDGCDPTVQVGSDANARCSLRFDLKSSSGPNQLRYTAPGVAVGLGDMRTATASIAVEPCSPCGTECTYLDRDVDNCGACGQQVSNNAVTSDGRSIHMACLAGVPTCDPTMHGTGGAPLTYCAKGNSENSADHPVCSDLPSDPLNCGACGADIGNGNCVNGKPSCTAGETYCSMSGCVNLKMDSENCGACGATGGTDGTCTNGVIGCYNKDLLCMGKCTQQGTMNCGSCGHACTKNMGDECTSFAAAGYTCEHIIVVTPSCDDSCCATTCTGNGYSDCVRMQDGSCYRPGAFVDCACAY
jgi:hypothetical protein